MAPFYKRCVERRWGRNTSKANNGPAAAKGAALTFLVQHHCGDAEPAPVRVLGPVTPVQAARGGRSEKSRGDLGREDGEAGDLVNAAHMTFTLYLDLHAGQASNSHQLGLDLDIVDTVPACPLGDPHHAALVLFEGEFPFWRHLDLDHFARLESGALVQCAGGNSDPVVPPPISLGPGWRPAPGTASVVAAPPSPAPVVTWGPTATFGLTAPRPGSLFGNRPAPTLGQTLPSRATL